jgi:hypothetical protein
MKTLTKIMGLVLIGTLVGCGKDNSSGTSSSKAPVTNTNQTTNPYSNQVPSPSQAAFNNFKSWYLSTSEGAIPGIGQRTEVRSLKTYSQSNNCQTNPISLFGVNIVNVNYCFSSSSPSSTQELERQINVLPAQNKSLNSKLAQIYQGTNMTLVSASEFPVGTGKLFQIEYKTSNNEKIVYQVDTRINSAFNPVYILDSGAKTIETLLLVY